MPKAIRPALVVATAGKGWILLHGFIKKAQKTPATDLNMARKRLAELKERDS